MKIERRTIKVVHVICEKSKFIVFLFSYYLNQKRKRYRTLVLDNLCFFYGQEDDNTFCDQETVVFSGTPCIYLK